MRYSVIPLLAMIMMPFLIGSTSPDIESEIKEMARPVVQRFFDACKARGLEGMPKDLSKTMLEALPANEFEKDDKRALSNYGEMVSWEYAGWVREDGFDIVHVHAKNAKGDTIEYEFIFEKGFKDSRIQGVKGEKTNKTFLNAPDNSH